MKIYDIAILGAGASGLMAASLMPTKNIAVIDSNSKIGLKILASGGGKCNITNKNVTVNNYLGDKKFIKKALDNFTPKQLFSFLDPFYLEFEVRKYGQYFCKKSAKDLVAVFENLTRHCTFHMNSKVLHVDFKESFIIQTQKEKIYAKKLIIASGGISYTAIGASPIGYEIAKSFGHSLITPAPALVGLTVQKEQFWMKSLSGISFNAKLSVEDKVLESDLLFTHKGISGPVVLSGSLYWKKGKISFDFLPNIDLSKLLEKKSKKQISSLIPLPKRFMTEFLKSIDLEDKSVVRLKKEELEKLNLLKNYEFAPAGNFGFTKAEVTKGGVNTDEIDAVSFESKLQKKLYFIGEVLDVTGELGGYNFQWAFASANSLATHI
ncbi:NAD(P)/FAD-dependent oxidoreductase [Sulfurospirillum arcachonense]|uniref:NAD(P)/FAD-dependent oxidoreductase n=1 Tax=Sulfurospirillum arcachonense TaxID=57666 RepID=UPI0004688F7E|nr:aminoacetone oxidase family FAD-binding enzyme [Sulfurospirillum arcachonense]